MAKLIAGPAPAAEEEEGGEEPTKAEAEHSKAIQEAVEKALQIQREQMVASFQLHLQANAAAAAAPPPAASQEQLATPVAEQAAAATSQSEVINKMGTDFKRQSAALAARTASSVAKTISKSKKGDKDKDKGKDKEVKLTGVAAAAVAEGEQITTEVELKLQQAASS